MGIEQIHIDQIVKPPLFQIGEPKEPINFQGEA